MGKRLSLILCQTGVTFFICHYRAASVVTSYPGFSLCWPRGQTVWDDRQLSQLQVWDDRQLSLCSLAIGSLSRACYAWFIGVRRGTCGGRGVAVGKGRRATDVIPKIVLSIGSFFVAPAERLGTRLITVIIFNSRTVGVSVGRGNNKQMWCE